MSDDSTDKAFLMAHKRGSALRPDAQEGTAASHGIP